MRRSNAALTRELKTIHASFRRLAMSFTKLAPHLTAIPETVEKAAAKAGIKPAGRKPRLSRQQRAALKLQGRYMGTMRGLQPGQRAKVKKLRAAKGIRAAIRAAERMAGSN